VLDRQPEAKCHRFILLVERESHKSCKEAGYNIFTGLTQGTVKVLRNPEKGPKRKKGPQRAQDPQDLSPGGDRLGINGAIHTAPAAAIEVLLGLHRLHLQVGGCLLHLSTETQI
jgi:hypothetical protein